METINVLTGEVNASNENIIFKSSAIGSCVVIAGYDKKLMVGGMAHVMLPGVSPEKSKTPKTRYAQNAIEEMIERMISSGARNENIEVCVVGGSNVLKRKDDTICQANINSVLKILNEKNIKIKAKSVGGTERRSVLFDTKTGNVYHSIGSEKDELLSCFIGDD
ncbi:MAG: chemotaxis protein CheD [Rikenellaceae bacterium]